MEPEEALGKAVRMLRKRKKLSQEALAHAAGIERNYISLIELGRNSPSIRIVYKLCAVLELRPAELFALVDAQMFDNLDEPPKPNASGTQTLKPS